MKKKVLLISTTSSMIKHFNMDNIKILQNLGATVYVGTNFKAPGSITESGSEEFKKKLEKMGVFCFQVDFKRRVGSLKSNIHVIKQIRKIIKENNIDGLHVQSPLGGVLGRIAAHKMNVKVLYTVHGFQFFSGGSKKDWILYYPVERFLSRWCNALVTINTNDFKIAQKFPTRVFYIPGVGTNIIESQSIPFEKRRKERAVIRNKLGVSKDDFLILSVGELNKNKNHQLVIRAIKKLDNPKIKYVIAGTGNGRKDLENLIHTLGLEKQVKLLGYINNLDGLYFAADLNVFVSKREGLGFGGLDGVSHGLYIVGNSNTGMKDYILNEKIGQMIDDPNDVDQLVSMLTKIIKKHPRISKDQNKYFEKYDRKNVNQIMKSIYKNTFFSEELETK